MSGAPEIPGCMTYPGRVHYFQWLGNIDGVSYGRCACGAIQPTPPAATDTACACTGWDGCPNPSGCGTPHGCRCGL